METGKINTKNDNIGRLKFEGKLTNDHKEIVSVYIYCTMTNSISSRSLGLVMDLMELNKLK